MDLQAFYLLFRLTTLNLVWGITDKIVKIVFSGLLSIVFSNCGLGLLKREVRSHVAHPEFTAECRGPFGLIQQTIVKTKHDFTPCVNSATLSKRQHYKGLLLCIPFSSLRRNVRRGQCCFLHSVFVPVSPPCISFHPRRGCLKTCFLHWRSLNEKTVLEATDFPERRHVLIHAPQGAGWLCIHNSSPWALLLPTAEFFPANLNNVLLR